MEFRLYVKGEIREIERGVYLCHLVSPVKGEIIFGTVMESDKSYSTIELLEFDRDRVIKLMEYNGGYYLHFTYPEDSREFYILLVEYSKFLEWHRRSSLVVPRDRNVKRCIQ